MTALISTAQTFYRRLNDNNTKDWWQDNKATYDTELKAPALALLDRLAPDIAALVDLPVTTKLFRPHRDVRFSKDKTPYQTHLHMMWGLDSGARQSPVFFFGIGLDYVTAGAGIMGFDKPVLEDWRKMVDLDTDRMLGIFADLDGAGFRLREPALKRVPPPYDKDHRAGHLLRMKGVTASREIGDGADLDGAILSAFGALVPLVTMLIQIAEA